MTTKTTTSMKMGGTKITIDYRRVSVILGGVAALMAYLVVFGRLVMGIPITSNFTRDMVLISGGMVLIYALALDVGGALIKLRRAGRHGLRG